MGAALGAILTVAPVVLELLSPFVSESFQYGAELFLEVANAIQKTHEVWTRAGDLIFNQGEKRKRE